MRQGIVLLIFSLALSTNSYSQLGGLLNKVKNKVTQRADKKVDDSIDKGLDKVEGKNTEPASKSVAMPVADTTSTEDNALKSYTKFDFIPGDSILYSEDFQQDEIGELPLHWNTSGTGEVTTLDRYPGHWLRLHKQFVYLSANQKKLGDNYTVEFDLILQLKNNGWMYPVFDFGLFASKNEPDGGNNFLKDYKKNAAVIATFNPGEFKSSKAFLNSFLDNKPYFNGDAKALENIETCYGKPVHIAIQVQKERFRMWVNQDKLFDVPKGVPTGQVMDQLVFSVGHTNYAEEQYGIYVSNLKVATGHPDTRHQLVEEGKFSTTGILFDFQSAVIRPESYAVVKEIAAVLTGNAALPIKIVGHTSSDGDDKANLELSKKRAAAVKDLLHTEFGIDTARLQTEGKGETQPIADNKTKEGKAANRRVEFIKL